MYQGHSGDQMGRLQVIIVIQSQISRSALKAGLEIGGSMLTPCQLMDHSDSWGISRYLNDRGRSQGVSLEASARGSMAVPAGDLGAWIGSDALSG